MGYWYVYENGDSFAKKTESDLLWGDGPADILDACLENLCANYQTANNQKPAAQDLIDAVVMSLKADTRQLTLWHDYDLQTLTRAFQEIDEVFLHDVDRLPTDHERILGALFSVVTLDVRDPEITRSELVHPWQNEKIKAN